MKTSLRGIMTLAMGSVFVCGAMIGPSHAQEVLTLTGDNPNVSFVDNTPNPDQKWQILANVSGFKVRDITNAMAVTEPFRLDLGLPTDALRVKKDSFGDTNVGIGVVPDDNANLHIRSTINVAKIRLQHIGAPQQTWDLIVSGGAFTIFDRQSNKAGFQMEDGTPGSTLHLQDTGNIGMGTNNPVRTLHLFATENTPTLRFEDGSGTPHTWDIEADHLGFDLVNDPGTAFETRPFKVLPDAPDASLFVAANGSIGMGTDTPGKINGVTAAGGHTINVNDNAADARFVLQGASRSEFNIVHKGAAVDQKIFRIRNSNGFTAFNVVRDNLSNAVPNAISIRMSDGNIGLQVANPGNPLQLASGAKCTAGGVWTNASSREFKQDIAPLTSEQARQTVQKLQPVGYRYKNEPDEQYVGFIAEDVPDLVASSDRQSLSSMDITAVLTKVVQDQERTIAKLEQATAKLEQTNLEQRELNEKLLRRLDALERK